MSARRAVSLALGLWVARWAAMELASYVGHRVLPPGPPPNRRFTRDEPPNEGSAHSRRLR